MPKDELNHEKAILLAKLLSRLYLDRIDPDLLTALAAMNLADLWPFEAESQELECLRQIGLEQVSPEDLYAALRDDYMALFVGPGMPLAPLWGSVYLDEENFLLGASTRALEEFLMNAGIAPPAGMGEPLDHLGFMLAALAILLQRLQNGDAGGQVTLAEFLGRHFLPWAGRCLELQKQNAVSQFYRTLADLCRIFLLRLAACFGATVEKPDLHY